MKIEFEPKKHTYTVDGTPTPSVTKIIKLICDDPYNGVPKAVLERAANHGNKVHELVEAMALGQEVEEASGFVGIAQRRFVQLKEERLITAASCEQCVAYVKDGLPLYAGTYDMLGTVDGDQAIIDIKTTEKIHRDMLKIQLSLYAWAIEQMTGVAVPKAYVLWLPKKDLGQIEEIEMTKPEILLPKVEVAYERFFSPDGETH